MSKPFKLKYTNGKKSDATAFPFKSPMKDPGHGAPGYHEHTNDPKINMEDYRNQHKFPPNNPGYAVADPFGFGTGGAYGGGGGALPKLHEKEESGWGHETEHQEFIRKTGEQHTKDLREKKKKELAEKLAKKSTE